MKIDAGDGARSVLSLHAHSFAGLLLLLVIPN